MNACFNICFLTLFFVVGSGLAAAQAESAPSEVEVTIQIFSGLPNPVMKLDKSEIGEYQRLLNQFRAPQPGQEKAIPIYAQYGGLRIDEFGPGHTLQVGRLVYGDRDLNPTPEPDAKGEILYSSNRIGPNDSLERYLIELARGKRVIRENVYQAIIEDIKSRTSSR